MHRADTNNGTGNRVSGADGNAECCRGKERGGGGNFGASAIVRSEFGDAHAHGFDDAPAAAHRTDTNGGVTD